MRRLFILALIGCTAPDAAPLPIDEVSSFVFDHYFDDDATFARGVNDFLVAFDADRDLLLGPDEDIEVFRIHDLTTDDIDHLPIASTYVSDAGDGSTSVRDPADAGGVVSVAELNCSLDRVATALMRHDQDAVFPDDWLTYARTSLSDEDRFREAHKAKVFPALPAAVDPYVEMNDELAQVIWLTANIADPPSMFTGIVDIDDVEMRVDMRQGVFATDEGPVEVFAMMTWMPESGWGSSNVNGLLQNYSVELNIARGDQTVRLFSVWSQPFSKTFAMDAESDFTLKQASTRARLVNEQLRDACSGE